MFELCGQLLAQCREYLQLSLVLAGETQDEVARALLYVAVDPFHCRSGRAREAGLMFFQHVRAPAVIGRQKIENAARAESRINDFLSAASVR